VPVPEAPSPPRSGRDRGIKRTGSGHRRTEAIVTVSDRRPITLERRRHPAPRSCANRHHHEGEGARLPVPICNTLRQSRNRNFAAN
jgi:hypothetical protein